MKKLTADEQTFFLCIQGLFGTQEREAFGAHTDWQRVFEMAQRHKVVPILAAHAPREFLPVDLLHEIERETRRQKMRFAVMNDAFRAIAWKLSAVEIPFIPFKGISLASTIYPAGQLRYFDDIDILIHPSDSEKATDVLEALDYRLHPLAPTPDWHHLPPYVHARHYAMVELHTDVVRRLRGGWDIEGIWFRAMASKEKDSLFMDLALPDALISSALHARHNLYNRLTFFIDTALLFQRITSQSSDLTLLEQLAGEAGARCSLAYLVSFARDYFLLAEAPDIKCSPINKRIARFVCGWDGFPSPRPFPKQGPLPRMAELTLMDSVGDTMRAVPRLLAPPAEFVGQRYSEESESSWRGYVRRILERGLHAVRQLLGTNTRRTQKNPSEHSRQSQNE